MKGMKPTMEKIKENINKVWNEKTVIAGLIIAKACVGIQAQASVVNTGVPELDSLLNKIVLVLGGVVSLYGLIKLINGVKAWSDANEEMDAARKSQGMQTIISGAVCVLVLPILAFLGFALS